MDSCSLDFIVTADRQSVVKKIPDQHRYSAYCYNMQSSIEVKCDQQKLLLNVGIGFAQILDVTIYCMIESYGLLGYFINSHYFILLLNK